MHYFQGELKKSLYRGHFSLSWEENEIRCSQIAKQYFQLKSMLLTLTVLSYIFSEVPKVNHKFPLLSAFVVIIFAL